MKLSVVIATHNRLPLLLDLLGDLERQTLKSDEFEVIIIDDGSTTPVQPVLARRAYAFQLTVRSQVNLGPAAARHRGVVESHGEVVVFLDDDMHVEPDFLEAHLRAHERGATVVQGHIAPPESVATMPLFERFHAYQLERFVADVKAGRERIRGIHLCTGNVSVRRADYFAVGGFDATLARSEDRELGIRLEQAGGSLVLSTDARSVHRSDHESLERWLQRSFDYGVYDLKIASKHPEVEIADPWRFWFLVSPLSRPFLTAAVLSPMGARPLAHLVMSASRLADRARLEKLAIAGTTLCYGLQYFRGLRLEAGSLEAAGRGFRAYAGRRLNKSAASTRLTVLAREVAADYRAIIATRRKYNREEIPFSRWSADLVRRVGFQMMAAVRLMELLRDSDQILAAQVVSRLIRHLYGAEIHWEARIAPGVMLIHGVGLVISHAAQVGPGCILFHNVTLGESTDPETRKHGAPVLERNVHVGPGATLLGPIRVGEGSKIMAGAVLTHSVPPYSLVRPVEATVGARLRSEDLTQIPYPATQSAE